MMITVESADYRKVSDLVERRVGIVLSEERAEQLGEAIREEVLLSGTKNFSNYFELISQAPISDPLFQALLERVTIGETFFFRDSNQFQALRELVLPELIKKNRAGKEKINILSAGCSTGEEPFSVAILLYEMIGQGLGQVNLMGGDINLASLTKAVKANYSKWSFRGVDTEIRDRYFSPNGDYYQLSDEIRGMVRFQYLNLAEELPFDDLDLILLRNVTIYFSPAVKEQLFERCFKRLKPGGWLIIGAGELNQRYFRRFEEVSVAGTILYRKGSALKEKAPSPLSLDQKPKQRATEWPAPVIKQSSPKAQPKEEVYKRAEQRFQQNDLIGAERLLSEIIETDARALLLMARIEANRGRHNKGESYCNRYLAKQPDSIEAYYLLGLIYQSEGNLKRAAEVLRHAIFLDRNFVMGQWNLALVYQKLGETQAYRRHLMQVKTLLSRLPEDLEISFSEGQSAARMLQIVEMLLRGKIE